MELADRICLWISELCPLLVPAAVFLYGITHFFQKRKSLYPQIVTLAMGCYCLGYLYHLCQMLALGEVADGFSPAYLGRIGCYLFLFTGNYGYMDGIMDDGSRAIRPSRIIAFLGPVAGLLLFSYCAAAVMPLSTKITYAIVWIPAMLSMYYNLKHALIPDQGFGFAKAVRPYNMLAFLLTLLDLLLLLAWTNYDEPHGYIPIAIFSVLFSCCCVGAMYSLRKGVQKWTI